MGMYRGSSSLGCGTVQVRRVWFILLSHPSHCHPALPLSGHLSGAWPRHHCSHHGDCSRSEALTCMLAQALLAQASNGDLIAPEVTFCGCAASVPAAADEHQSWILLQWKMMQLMDQRKCQLLQMLRQECWASQRKGCRFHSPLLLGQACFARRWEQEFLQTQAWCRGCWAQ